MEIISTEDYTLYIAAIPAMPRGSRREAERAAVATLLGAAVPGAELCHDDAGAPFLQGGGDTHISVSHSRGYAVLAVSQHRIGVDMEEYARKTQLERVSARFVRPDDNLSIGSLLAAWTAKEAVFKAAGLRDAVLADIRLTDAETAALGGRRFSLKFHEFDDALIAVAL